MYSGYNTYSVDWAPNEIVWSVNGHPYYTATPQSEGGTWEFNGHPFYLIFDVNQGGAFGGSGALTHPLNMDVAYVEVTTSTYAFGSVVPSIDAADSGPALEGSVPEPGTVAATGRKLLGRCRVRMAQRKRRPG